MFYLVLEAKASESFQVRVGSHMYRCNSNLTILNCHVWMAERGGVTSCFLLSTAVEYK